MKILRVINNNNVCVLNERGKEQIVSGKGIGFGKKPNDEVETGEIQKTYLITDSGMQKRMIELLQEIPEGYIRFTDSLITHIRETLNCEINDSLLITLSDHLCFAVKRKRQGLELTNPLLDTLRLCYPEELKLGYYCLNQIETRLKVRFIPDEAGFIAMHIINARLHSEMSDTYLVTKMLSGCMEIAKARFPQIDESGEAHERYLIHLKYLAQRIFQGKPLPGVLSRDRLFMDHVTASYSSEYACADEIREYILETTGQDITAEEVVTLTLHIAKLTSG